MVAVLTLWISYFKLNRRSWVTALNQFNEGRTRVFSRCVISWFYFPWNMKVGNFSSWLLIWRICVAREELELVTDIRDLTTLFPVILRREFSEWLESSIQSNLGMRFTIWNLDFTLRDFAFFKHSFLCKNRLFKSILLIYLFSWFGKLILYFFFRSRTVPETPPPTPLPPSLPPVRLSLN